MDVDDLPDPLEQDLRQLEQDFRQSVYKEALQLLQRGEQPKVDFKREPPDIARLAREIAAIANTDDPEGGYYRNRVLRDHGFVIIGVESGEVRGYESWGGLGCGVEEERVKDCLTQKLKEYIAPLPNFSLYRFEDPQTNLPFWVVLIYPSKEQPHLVVKDGSEVERFTIYVRKGSVTERASIEDYTRFLRKAVRGVADSLDGQVEELRRRVENLEEKLVRIEALQEKLLEKLVEVGLSALPSPLEPLEPTSLMRSSESLEEVARSWRLLQEDPVERALWIEVKNLKKYLDSLPWEVSNEPEEWKRFLEGLQEKALPFLRGLGELIQADKEEKYVSQVGEALGHLALAAIRPTYVSSYTTTALSLRLYPLLLAAYHLGILAHFHRKPGYLRLLLEVSLPERNGKTAPLLPWLRDRFYSSTHELFEALYPKYCDPLGGHLYTFLFARPAPTWFGLPPGVREGSPLSSSSMDPTGTFAVYIEGEFVLGLLALKPQLAEAAGYRTGEVSGERVRPLVGLYIFEGVPLSRVKALVARPPVHLCQVLGLSGQSLKQYLEVLAANLSKGLWRGCFSASGVFRSLSEGQMGSCP